MSMRIRVLEKDDHKQKRAEGVRGLPERSYLEWKAKLPFMWIEGAAGDDFSKENLMRSVIQRNDLKARSLRV